MKKPQRNLSEQNLYEIIKKSDTGLNFAKDRDETLSNYAPHSTQSNGFKKKTRFRYTDENDEWDKYKEKRSLTNRPQLTRVVFRQNRPNDPLSNDIYRKHYEPFMTTSKFEVQTARNTQYPSKDATMQQDKNETVREGDHWKTQFHQRKTSQFNDTVKKNLYNQTNGFSAFNRRNMTKSSTSLMPKSFYSTQQLPNQRENTNNNNSMKLKAGHQNTHQRQRDAQDSTNYSNDYYQQKKDQDELYQLENDRNFEYDQENPEYDEEQEQQAILDQISNQDWYQLLPEEVLNNKNIDLDKFFIDNSEYFYNLLCQNAQMKSTKPFFFNNDYTPLKLKYNPAFNTTYNKQFFRKTQQYQSMPQLTDKMMQTQFLGQKQIDYTSQKQNDYKDHGVTEVERRVQQYQPTHKPFMGLTSYNSNFINWRDYNKQVSKTPHHVSTVSEIPFMGKTSYQEAFSANKTARGDIPHIEKKQLFKSPIPTYPLFFGETQYATTYKPFQIKTTPHQATIAEVPEVEKNMNETKFRTTFYSSIPSFKGQYKSVSKKDFGPQRDQNLFTTNLKKAWRNKIIKKLEELKTIKEQKQLDQLRKQVENQMLKTGMTQQVN